MTDFLELQADSLLTKIMQWRVDGYKPDIVFIAIGAHSAYMYEPAEAFSKSMTALRTGVSAWSQTLVCTAQSITEKNSTTMSQRLSASTYLSVQRFCNR